EINKQIDELKPEYDEFQKQYQEKLDVLKKAEAARDASGADIPKMAERRKDIHNELVSINDKRQEVYNAWKAKEDEYYKCMKGMKPVRDEIFKLMTEDREK